MAVRMPLRAAACTTGPLTYPPAPMTRSGFTSVSYTHLDVYKRQVMLMITPRAPEMLVSKSGLEMAALAASSALFTPLAEPTPMCGRRI